MPLGDQPLGTGTAGLDAPVIPERAVIRAVHAKVYDPKNRRWSVDFEGQYESQHPVDQWVVMQLTWAAGEAKSMPQLGNPVYLLTHTGKDHASRVRNLLLRRLRQKVETGELRIASLEVSSEGNASFVLCDYVNLATRERRKLRV